MFAWTFTEFEIDPSGEETYASMAVEVELQPFAGASRCTVRGSELVAFFDELDSLARTSGGAAQVSGGWGDRTDVQLRFLPHGNRGHIALHIMLRGDPLDIPFRVEGTLILEPQPLTRFAIALRSAFLAREPERLELPS